LRISDGALSEYICSDCRAYLEKYPCDFINLKTNKLYSDNYQKWLDFAAYEYYFDEKPIDTINNTVNLIKQKVHKDCRDKIDEIENIRIRLIESVKEIEQK
jgi:hypothetical protein